MLAAIRRLFSRKIRLRGYVNLTSTGDAFFFLASNRKSGPLPWFRRAELIVDREELTDAGDALRNAILINSPLTKGKV